jgi:hypothetical protein
MKAVGRATLIARQEHPRSRAASFLGSYSVFFKSFVVEALLHVLRG